MAASIPLLLLSVLASLSPLALATTFRDGDYIHTSRKAQFHQSRTNWQDLLGQHCPRFGIDRLVAVPIPKPQLAFGKGDTYKLQFSFDGDRHLTPWLPLLGEGAPAVPLIIVTLRRSGEELLGATAAVLDAPEEYKQRHPVLVSELHNVTHWPKHVLVHYRFDTRNDVDLDRGLYVLFPIGLIAVLVLCLSALRGVQPKLAQFLADVTAEGTTAASAMWKGSEGKGE
ncbi:hypothetical protein CHLRE_01g049450v5 [Chlamydomonas reinhardtii]|uniref:Uncharacterized protein n=1 Tax=Chlamydomonas reinhardtii TaxID=3055 RepID=A8HNA5_CHLRE|nr:uncharacterized protein CHLRE_01g049450v5 [Chlamydomonas reinhardtii]PNW88892.1 hypothetical protein CHLRE_01g049450v5 [Chlamydomonas reinhardtii]|eukprot:XP_001690235.1 predicted protein [Chlamydomonas reinhardtii]